MIKVLEEKPVPRGTVTCSNCGSVLEYGNADLHKDYEAEQELERSSLYAHSMRLYCFNCPVCGVKVSASWISNKKDGDV